jgi:transcriptional regulator of nitric oxide reductase
MQKKKKKKKTMMMIGNGHDSFKMVGERRASIFDRTGQRPFERDLRDGVRVCM